MHEYRQRTLRVWRCWIRFIFSEILYCFGFFGEKVFTRDRFEKPNFVTSLKVVVSTDRRREREAPATEPNQDIFK